jgi:hypothetical protein
LEEKVEAAVETARHEIRNQRERLEADLVGNSEVAYYQKIVELLKAELGLATGDLDPALRVIYEIAYQLHREEASADLVAEYFALHEALIQVRDARAGDRDHTCCSGCTLED